MNILQVAKQCCYRTGDNVVDHLFSDQDNSREWLGYLSEAIALIPNEHKWAALVKDYVFTTSGKQAVYDLPDDFKSMVSYCLYNLTHHRIIPVSNADKELRHLASGDRSQSSISYRIMGGKIVFTYPIEDQVTIGLSYFSKNTIKHTNSVGQVSYSDRLTDNTDEFVLSDELLILKAIMLRAVNLGFPEAAQRESNYLKQLEQEMADDGANVLFNTASSGFINKTTPVEWSVAR